MYRRMHRLVHIITSVNTSACADTDDAGVDRFVSGWAGLSMGRAWAGLGRAWAGLGRAAGPGRTRPGRAVLVLVLCFSSVLLICSML